MLILSSHACYPLQQLQTRVPLWLFGALHQRMQLLRLLDRIDIHVEVPRVDYEKLADKRQVENSATIRTRI